MEFLLHCFAVAIESRYEQELISRCLFEMSASNTDRGESRLLPSFFNNDQLETLRTIVGVKGHSFQIVGEFRFYEK